MQARRISCFLLFTTALFLGAAWPVHAEYHWNPFDNMTNAQASMVFVMIGLLYLFTFIGWPLLLGSLTYFVLKRTHPIASAKIGRVLLFCCLTCWLLGIATASLFGLLPLGNLPVQIICGILKITIQVAGAAFGYFQQRTKSVA